MLTNKFVITILLANRQCDNNIVNDAVNRQCDSDGNRWCDNNVVD